MKLLTVLSLLFINFLIGFAQPTIIVWEKGYGGSSTDIGYNIIQNPNQEFLICGTTSSRDFDAMDNHNYSPDLWFLNLNDSGSLNSKKCFGGSWREGGLSLDFKHDEFIVLGSAESQDFDLAGVHSMALGEDFWFLKVDTNLNISFQKTFGSIGHDKPLKMIISDDGGFVFLGKIGMYGHDVDTSYGQEDLWVFKTDSSLNIIWQITLGSQSFDDGGDIVETSEGGYLVVGGALMNNGSVSCAPFSGTIWLIKLNSSGGVIWQKCMSSSYAKKAIATNDGGFVIVAKTFDNTIPGYSDLSDYLIFKVDSLGNQQWAHCYGGSMFDEPNDLIQCSDGGFIIAGTSDSYDYYATTNHGGSKDALLVKVDSLGNFQWSQCYGGIDHETCNSVIETADGGLALTGSTKSVIGLPHYGLEDLWVLKVNYSGNGIITPDNSIEQFKCYATIHGVGIEFFSKKNQDVWVSIYDVLGKKILSDNNMVNEGKVKLNFNLDEFNGLLIIDLKTTDGRVVSKLIK